MNSKTFGEWVIRLRWWIVLSTLVFVVGAASGGRYLGFSTNYRVFFSKENPELNAFEALQDTYTKNDNVLFAIAPKNGQVFTRETLAVVEELTQAAWQIPYSLRVDSVTNFQHTWADGDDLIVEDLVKDAARLTESDLERIQKIALSEPLLVNRLVSHSGHVTGVNVTINLPQKSLSEVPEVVQFVRNMAEDIQAKHPGIRVHLSGMVMLNNAFTEASQNDMATLVPVMFLVLIITMGLLLRSFSGTFSTVMVIGLSAATAMGLAGWMGILITPISASAPTIILTLAIADSIHVLVTLFQEMRRGRPKREAIIESLRINLQPVFLTSITTAIGFLSLNFSDAPPFHDLGNIVAMGVVAAFFYSVLFLPAMMAILPVRVKARANGQYSFMDRFGGFVVNQRKRLLWGMLALIVVLAASVPRNQLNDMFVNYFDDGYAFRTDTDFIVENLSGIYQIEYSLGTGEEGGVSDPAYLAKLEEFAAWYRQQPGVLHVSTLTDIMKRLNKNMHADDPSYYRIPDERDLAAQYLLLYEMSLPFGLDLNNQVDINKSATRFSVTLENLSTREMLQLETSAQRWLQENASVAMQVPGASPNMMFAHISERNINSMLGGTTAALVLISFILILALRSAKIGLISLVPNLVPAAMAFGLWGLLVGEIGMGTSIVAAVSLGIVVDDTVHFLSKYLRARREHGMDAAGAVRYSFHTVGTALLITSLVLIAGFFVLTFSGFAINSQMGLLTAIAIAFALTADFLFLPPLLMAFERKPTEKRITPPTRTSLQGGLIMKRLIVLSVFALSLVPFQAIAETPEEKGLAIAIEADKRDTGFGDFMADLLMILKNRHGDESIRSIRSRTLEMQDDGDKSLVIFDRPADIKGTAFLSFTHKVGADDQWLYLPALKRVKRISSANKSGSFMGSEFAYEDVTSQEVEKYTYRWLRDEVHEGQPTFVIERDPVDPKSGYTRQVVWIDQAEYRSLKIDFYDRKNVLLKTLTFKGYQQYLGQYWRARQMDMVNHQTGKSTRLIWDNYQFRTGLKDRDFNKNSLKRAR